MTMSLFTKTLRRGYVATKDEIIAEMGEVRQDLLAFQKARDSIQSRLLELEGTSRYETLASWPATVAIVNVLILAAVRCEGLIEDYQNALDKLDNTDNVIRLVKE
jgi:hypothetical protein